MSNKRIKKRGTKVDVWNGLAEKTKGGLVKSDLIENKKGKIVSKKKYQRGLLQIEHLIRHNLNRRKEKRKSDSSDEDSTPELNDKTGETKPDSPVVPKS